MLIGSRQRLWTFQSAPNLTINGTPNKQLSQAKSLGVYVDKNLSWTTHINEITKKIASGIGALKPNPNTLMIIFNSLVQLHFNYCCVIWDSCCKTLAAKQRKLQNRAARFLTFSGYDASADPLIEILGWQKLESQRTFHKDVMVYKSLKGSLLNTRDPCLYTETL